MRTNSRPLSIRNSFAMLLFGMLGGLWTTVAAAQSHTIYFAPTFVYNEGYFDPPTPYETTLSAAWADVQAVEDRCTGGGTTCYTVVNLHPNTTGPLAIQFNGTWYWNYFDQNLCQTTAGGQTTCDYTSDLSAIQTGIVCPDGSGAGTYNQTGTNRLVACAKTVYDVQPPPKNCQSCIGNPIYAATGQKLQVETDYSGDTGLSFSRTYRSNNGYSASVLSQTFVDNSSTAGTISTQCYPAHWTYGNASGSYCFPYISVYPYVNSGVAQYQLQTEDGRSIQFTGPHSAITAAADINERVTQVPVNGANAWRVQREDDSIEIYSAAGSLIQKTLRGGKTFTYTYSTSSTPTTIAPAAGLLLTQSDAFGHTLSWQYNSAGQMTQMTDPAGMQYSYQYNGSSNLPTSVTYPDGSSKTYWYNESANTPGASLPTALTGITDENGVRFATFQYNSGGYAVNTQHAGGVDSYTFTYPYTSYAGANYTASVLDPLGTMRTYNFTADGLSYNQDSSQVQPAASGSGTVTQSETYDANGNPRTVTDYNGNVTTYVYDLTRNLEISRTEASGTAVARTIGTQWNATWRQPSLITEPNRTTGFTYDALGNVHIKTITDTTVTPNTTRSWTYTFDSYGRMLTVDGPRTDVVDKTTYSYYTCTTGYQCGEIQTITNALGQVTTFNSYNAHGQPLVITDPNGIVTTLTYDARQRLKSRQVSTETTLYSYYPTGLLKLVTLPDTSTIQFTYDPAHRLTDITDGLGNHVHYTLDASGNRTGESTYDPSNALRRTHTRVINALNEVYQEVNAAGTAAVTTTLGYDNNGNLTSSDAPLSRNTGNTYDALNRLHQITDPNGGATLLGYDANDNLVSVQDPRTLLTNYTLNGFGDVTQVVSPDTGTTGSTYNSGGDLATTTDARGATAHYAYDALDRLIQIAYSDNTIRYNYDTGTNGIGRLTGASDSAHSMSWSHDALGRVTGKGQTVYGAPTLSVGYAYSNGDLVSLVTPSGQTVTYAYTNHQITSVMVGTTTILSGVTYFPYGPVSGWTWGNGQAATRTYDTDEKISALTIAGDPISFSYDNAFRIDKVTDSYTGANTWTLGYDVLDRLDSASKTGTTYGWTYDPDGNRLTQSGTVASAFTPSPTSNRLNSTSGALSRSYSYDAAGNTSSYSNLAFTYNQRGRASSVTVGSVTTNYVYNALGQLMKKTVGGVTTFLVYDEMGHLLGEYSSNGALIQETVWMGDIPVATLRPSSASGTIFYVHTDQLNAPRKVTRLSDNSPMWRWDTDPMGTAAPNQNPYGFGTFIYNLRFPGQYYQAETGLNYNYFRDYDPQTGRYVESDPIGLDGGSFSTYAYAGGNPIGYFDSRGLGPQGQGGYQFPSTWPGGPYFDPQTPQAAQLNIALQDVLQNIANTAANILEPAQDATSAAIEHLMEARINDPNAQAEHDEYKRQYDAPPPPFKDPCEELAWQIRREENLLAARQAWDTKWLPGRHAGAQGEIQSRNRIAKLKAKMKLLGCKCP